jgi:uncharacterized protein with HEPN domain
MCWKKWSDCLSLRDDTISMRQMLDAAHRAVRHTSQRSFDEFSSDEVLILAVWKLVEIVGEAANRVSESTRDQYPTMAWRASIATRNRLSHGYDSVNLETLYQIVKHDLPTLITQLEDALDSRTES